MTTEPEYRHPCQYCGTLPEIMILKGGTEPMCLACLSEREPDVAGKILHYLIYYSHIEVKAR